MSVSCDWFNVCCCKCWVTKSVDGSFLDLLGWRTALDFDAGIAI